MSYFSSVCDKIILNCDMIIVRVLMNVFSADNTLTSKWKYIIVCDTSLEGYNI